MMKNITHGFVRLKRSKQFFGRPVGFMQWHFGCYSQMMSYRVSWKHNKSIPVKLPTIDGKKTCWVNKWEKYLFMRAQVQYMWRHYKYASTYHACGRAFYTDKHARASNHIYQPNLILKVFFFSNQLPFLKANRSTVNSLLVSWKRKHYYRLWKSSALVNSDERHYCDYCLGKDMPASLSFLILHQATAGGDLVLLSPNWMWPFLGDRVAAGVFLLLWESVNKKKSADPRMQRKVLISAEIK